MSRFFPHTPYAEDQPLPKTILTTHVLTRGFQVGTILGAAISPPLYYLRRTDRIARNFPKLAMKESIPRPGEFMSPKSLVMVTVRGAGIGAMVGTALLSVRLVTMMRGREAIEWKDRSWNLLENKFQVEVDDFTYSGGILGALSTVALRNKVPMGLTGGVGFVALGGLGGLLGYGGWRYGIHGGKFDEERDKEV